MKKDINKDTKNGAKNITNKFFRLLILKIFKAEYIKIVKTGRTAKKYKKLFSIDPRPRMNFAKVRGMTLTGDTDTIFVHPEKNPLVPTFNC